MDRIIPKNIEDNIKLYIMFHIFKDSLRIIKSNIIMEITMDILIK